MTAQERRAALLARGLEILRQRPDLCSGACCGAADDGAVTR